MLANGLQNLIERQVLMPLLAIPSVAAISGAVQAQEPGQAIGAELAHQYAKSMRREFLVRHSSRSEAFARYNSTRSVVQVATPQPKKSVSSVQIAQPSASAAARSGQSSSSRREIGWRATCSRLWYVSASTTCTTP